MILFGFFKNKFDRTAADYNEFWLLYVTALTFNAFAHQSSSTSRGATKVVDSCIFILFSEHGEKAIGTRIFSLMIYAR